LVPRRPGGRAVQCVSNSAPPTAGTAASAFASTFGGSSSGSGCGAPSSASSNTWSIHLTGTISR